MPTLPAAPGLDAIRYAQLWEDGDVLVDALATKPGATLVSIASAGDNALAMLLLDPARVVAIDLSPAQIACLSIRIAAYRTLDHASFLELMGSRPSARRGELLDRVASKLDENDQAFWSARRDDVIRHGLGGVGKFENYFRIFRTGCCRWRRAGRRLMRCFAPSRSPNAPPSLIAAGTIGAGG
ncbi:BtaA family protein [Devosia sp. A8/3-2]|nr:BtaA family protein [Devosia sp. A8/3-2]